MGAMFDAITRWDNLWRAYRLAARGKRKTGSAAVFEHQLADRLIALQCELRLETYGPARTATSSSTSRSGARSAPPRFATASRIMRCATSSTLSSTHVSSCTAMRTAPARAHTERSIGCRVGRGGIATCCAPMSYSILRLWITPSCAPSSRVSSTIWMCYGLPPPSSAAARARSWMSTRPSISPATTCSPSTVHAGCPSVTSPRSSGPTCTRMT